jgi:hypothetical protein
MTMGRTFHIEIDVDNIDGQERMDEITLSVQMAAGQVFSQCVLICGDKVLPKIKIWAEDIESGRRTVPTLSVEDL